MSLPTHSRIDTYVFRLASLVLCLLPCAVSAQPPNAPDLRIENLSVYSTLPESGGFRRVSISFIVANRSSATAGASTTRVIIGNSGFSFGTPSLKPDEKAYISRPLRTLAAQLSISVVVDAFRNVPGELRLDNEVKYEANLRSEAGRWISIGPSKIRDTTNTFGPAIGVGRVTSLVVDPRVPDIVYLGARGSGIWKRNGSLWFPIGDSLPSLQIDAIGIYPRTPDRVVVATPMGVFESMDGGGVWSQLTLQNLNASGFGGGALLIENSDRPVMYVSTMSGVLISKDNGRNWTTVLRPGSRILSLQFSTTDPTHLLASTTNPSLVFEGKDRGLTPNSWKILTGCVATLPMPFPQDSNVWISESRGRRWVSIRDKTPGAAKAEIWRSTNRICELNGFTEHAWEKVSLSGDCARPANHFSYLFAHPTDPLILFKGGVELCRSEARGDSLKRVQKIHFDHHAIAIAPSDPSLMYFGTDGGIYRSADKGKTMEFIGEGLNNTEFFKIDVDGRSPAVVVGGSQDQFTSTWNGVSPVWNLTSAGGVDLSDSEFVVFNRFDMKGIFEIGQSTRQVRLLRPGGGQTRLGDSTLPDCCGAEASGKVRTSMASTGTNPRLLITCQGIWAGPPWRRIQDPSFDPIPTPDGCKFNPAGDFERLKLHSSGILVAVTNTGQVFHGFFKFPPLRKVFQPVTPASPSAISFDGPGRFYIATNSASLSTIDRFDCFTDCNRERVFGTNLGQITAMTIDPLAPDTVVAAVRNQGVVRGTRRGPNNWNWTSYSNGLPNGAFVTDLQARSNGRIVAATFGRGAFQSFSRVEQRPPSNEARGHVTSYENERVFPDQPPGPSNPVVENIELDSRPGFVFTSSSRFPRFAAIVRRAIERNRTVTIVFVPLNAQTGTIISVR